MPTNWTGVTGSTATTNSSTSVATTLTGITNGDLLVVVAQSSFNSTPSTAFSISDTGANTGWNAVGFTNIPAASPPPAAQVWWRTATGADGSSITITAVATGQTGTQNWFGICANHFTVTGGTVQGIDLTAITTVTAEGGNTLTWQPSVGASQPGNTDALAYTAMCGYAIGTGASGTNTFTGTSAAANLAQYNTMAQPPAAKSSTIQAVGGVQASATAASNTFVNSWVQSGSFAGFIGFGLTFTYLATEPQVMVV